MPELPEVQTICQSLSRQLLGLRIESAQQISKLRKCVASTDLDLFCHGKSITQVSRRAKYILIHFNDQSGLILHLGMTGCFIINPEDGIALKHERACWHLSDGRRWRFCDARRFGSLQLCPSSLSFEKHPALAGLGIEPLGEDFTGQYLKEVCQLRKVPIKTLLMDQSRVVGVGNIYASEALFRSRISPRKLASRLSMAQYKCLAKAIQDVLTAAIAAGGSTIRDYHDVDGSEGHFSLQLQVYGRNGLPCPNCNTVIRRLVQAGRSSFYCPHCQRG